MKNFMKDALKNSLEVTLELDPELLETLENVCDQTGEAEALRKYANTAYSQGNRDGMEGGVFLAAFSLFMAWGFTKLMRVLQNLHEIRMRNRANEQNAQED